METSKDRVILQLQIFGYSAAINLIKKLMSIIKFILLIERFSCPLIPQTLMIQ